MLEIGTRVYHHGERWAEAREFGTANVLEVKIVSGGGYEFLVQPDHPIAPDMPNDPRWWPGHFTYKAG
jgi:hypothetical protein